MKFPKHVHLVSLALALLETLAYNDSFYLFNQFAHLVSPPCLRFRLVVTTIFAVHDCMLSVCFGFNDDCLFFNYRSEYSPPCMQTDRMLA